MHDCLILLLIEFNPQKIREKEGGEGVCGESQGAPSPITIWYLANRKHFLKNGGLLIYHGHVTASWSLGVPT